MYTIYTLTEPFFNFICQLMRFQYLKMVSKSVGLRGRAPYVERVWLSQSCDVMSNEKFSTHNDNTFVRFFQRNIYARS